MRSHDITMASVEIKNFHCEPGPFNNSVNQCLEAHFINFAFNSLNSCRTILVEWDRQESLVTMGIQFHPGTRQEL